MPLDWLSSRISLIFTEQRRWWRASSSATPSNVSRSVMHCSSTTMIQSDGGFRMRWHYWACRGSRVLHNNFIASIPARLCARFGLHVDGDCSGESNFDRQVRKSTFEWGSNSFGEKIIIQLILSRSQVAERLWAPLKKCLQDWPRPEEKWKTYWLGRG